jgi:GNAT superfamily N-acetyltransferase
MDSADIERISVRDATPDDADALARVHADVARYYADLPTRFAGSDGGTLRLVAELDGDVVGALAARLLAPDEFGEQVQGDGETRLRIDYLATAAADRRIGIGTRLVEAAEQWGREGGATIAETTTFQGSPLSVPFWEDRMGYEERPMTLEKRLDPNSPA